jgi:hypothetical protein
VNQSFSNTARMLIWRFFRRRTLSLVRHILRTFVLHASIARPLGESGKLKLTSDMTELEFALSTFLLAAGGQDRRSVIKLAEIGDEYLALRAFRCGPKTEGALFVRKLISFRSLSSGLFFSSTLLPSRRPRRRILSRHSSSSTTFSSDPPCLCHTSSTRGRSLNVRPVAPALSSLNQGLTAFPFLALTTDVRWVEAHDEPEQWTLLEKGVKDAKFSGRKGWQEAEGLITEVLREAREHHASRERDE